MIDGARNAFLGYLYQLVGTAQVAILEEAGEADSGVMLRADVIPGRVVSERWGQDAAICAADGPQAGVTLIQFKHSSNLGSAIGREEFIKILYSFDRSKDDARKSGVEVDRYIVVTNRGTAHAVDEICSRRDADEHHPSLDVRRGRSRKVPKGKEYLLGPYSGDPEAAAKEWHRIVQRLDVQSGRTFQEGYDRLREFGSRHGILDREWNASVNRLFGAYFRETAGGHSIEVTLEWLKSHLLGDQDAANLDFRNKSEPHVTTRCKDRLRDQIRDIHRVPDMAYLDRELRQRIEKELQFRSVVFVMGRGGRGKSLAVARCLEAMAERQFTLSVRADEAKESIVVEEFSKIRMPRGGIDVPDRTIRDVVERLKRANGGARGLLLIDLDGLDEAPDRTHELRTLIKLCWARGRLDDSPASVIATCRIDTSSDQRVGVVSQWFDCETDMINDRVGFVEVGDFGDQELFEAARSLGGEPEQRILSRQHLTRMGGSMAEKDVVPHVFQSLHTPFVWGAYAVQNEDERNRILDGDQRELERLAGALSGRFFRRCWSRRNWSDKAAVERALAWVATCFGDQSSYTRSEWQRACSEEGLGISESTGLYSECLSFGVIESQADGRWSWAHGFLTTYIAAQFDCKEKGA